MKKMIELTDEAFTQAMDRVQREQSKGIRLALKGGGCAGFEYVMSYCSDSIPGDEIIDYGPITFYIDEASKPYLDGVQLDYVRKGVNEQFVFNNPNETGSCGCGVSAYF